MISLFHSHNLQRKVLWGLLIGGWLLNALASNEEVDQISYPVYRGNFTLEGLESQRIKKQRQLFEIIDNIDHVRSSLKEKPVFPLNEEWICAQILDIPALRNLLEIYQGVVLRRAQDSTQIDRSAIDLIPLEMYFELKDKKRRLERERKNLTSDLLTICSAINQECARERKTWKFPIGENYLSILNNFDLIGLKELLERHQIFSVLRKIYNQERMRELEERRTKQSRQLKKQKIHVVQKHERFMKKHAALVDAQDRAVRQIQYEINAGLEEKERRLRTKVVEEKPRVEKEDTCTIL